MCKKHLYPICFGLFTLLYILCYLLAVDSSRYRLTQTTTRIVSDNLKSIRQFLVEWTETSNVSSKMGIKNSNGSLGKIIGKAKIEDLGPKLEDIFSNFSLSFNDLKVGINKPVDNKNIHYQKFVVTRPKVNYTTKIERIPATEPSPTRQEPVYTNPHPYQFIINEERICGGNSSDVFVIIVVCSGLQNRQARVAIRETWGSSEELGRFNARLVFLVGSTHNNSLQRTIQWESDQHHDIIQENFLDTYRNLTLKSVALLKWVRDFCPKSKFVLKTDDDMYINVNILHKTLLQTRAVKTVLGQVFLGAGPIRTETSKWYTSEKDFPDKKYPKYCSGTAYVISTDLVGDLFQTSLNTKLFWLEDVYITGLCARQLQVHYVSNSAFTFRRRSPTGCSFLRAISGHNVTVKEMYKIRKELQSPNCSSKKKPK